MSGAPLWDPGAVPGFRHCCAARHTSSTATELWEGGETSVQQGQEVYINNCFYPLLELLRAFGLQAQVTKDSQDAASPPAAPRGHPNCPTPTRW